MIIDGKKIAAELREELKKKVVELKSKYNFAPGLTVILVGEDPASKIYVKNNKELFIDLGSEQGIYNRQIGIVTSGYNTNFLKKSDNLVFYVNEVFKNKSKIIPLSDEIEISKLNNMEIQFVE